MKCENNSWKKFAQNLDSVFNRRNSIFVWKSCVYIDNSHVFKSNCSIPMKSTNWINDHPKQTNKIFTLKLQFRGKI